MPERSLSLTHVRPLFRWLGIGTWPPDLLAPRPGSNENAGLERYASESRRDLLASICALLLDNELAIDPANLTLAWQAFSGASPGLSRRIAARAASGEKITQQWLDEVNAESGAGSAQDDLQGMFEALDKGVQQFTRSTSAARNATSEYQTDLGRHLLELEEVGQAKEMVSRLASLAQAMAARTRQTETELQAREQEAKSLRRLLGKARRDAERDHLTGLPNRRAFEAELERQHTEAAAAHEPLSLAFCDIDHFKRINDTHGHEAGDRVLKAIAQVLARSSNDNCHVSRHGGEEFVLLFRGLTPSEAKARLDRAREDLAARRLLNRDTNEPFGQITFSAGIANVAAHANPREALKVADDALYRAKQGGRNQVLVA
ncbi:MAG TPA: diguanylate cyclase [Croceibacterium sp.]